MGSKRGHHVLLAMIDSGIVVPGERVLECKAGGDTHYADLGEDGEIWYGESRVFDSLSAFNLYVVRQVNPLRRAVDGWIGVTYLGHTMAYWRATMDGYAEALSNPLSEGPDDPSTSAPLSNFHPSDFNPRRPTGQMSGDRKESIREVKEQQTRLCQYMLSNREHYQREVEAVFPEEMWKAWIQCSRCSKWRHAPHHLIVDGSFVCAAGAPKDWEQACEAPQAHSNEEIACMMEDLSHALHLSRSVRPPLEACSSEEFEEDLADFWEARGEEEIARDIREQRITRNHSPLDFLGLYRGVIERGGLIANELYDSRGWFCGAISFAGSIFPQMTNYFRGHKATSIGKELIKDYRRMLRPYEQCYADLDLPPAEEEEEEEGMLDYEGSEQRGARTSRNPEWTSWKFLWSCNQGQGQRSGRGAPVALALEEVQEQEPLKKKYRR